VSWPLKDKDTGKKAQGPMGHLAGGGPKTSGGKREKRRGEEFRVRGKKRGGVNAVIQNFFGGDRKKRRRDLFIEKGDLDRL